jgi:hypothetical protein
MADWILINGEKVDRAAFEANYAKANEQAWEKVALGANVLPRGCLICGAAVQRETDRAIAYQSDVGTLCAPCFERFVGPSTPP